MIPLSARATSRLSSSSFRKRTFALLFAIVALVAISCEWGEPDTGGETHFLRVCDRSSQTCGSGLSCVCGVCTVPCKGASACSSYPGALCVAPEVLSVGGSSTSDPSCTRSSQPASICDVYCDDDDDCAVLSSEHRCSGRSCRLADGSTRGQGGAGSGGSGGGTGCEGASVSANDVIILGDSFIASSHQITAYLEALARDAGALGEGYRYRDYSRLTNNALSWMGEGLLDQYQGAEADGAAQVVIMNGGGADVLLGTCDTVDSTCPLIVDAAAAFSNLIALLSDDGVAEVIFVGYPDPVPDEVRARMDALRPLLMESCSNGPPSCHWVDLRDAFEGNYDEYVEADGLNPSALGSRASAQAIWAVMQDECIAQ